MVDALKKMETAFLADVPEEYVFRSHTGHILRNMRELADELKAMPAESYSFHANAEKNDFANWVRDIIKDGKLAKDLFKARNQAKAAKTVAERVSLLVKTQPVKPLCSTYEE